MPGPNVVVNGSFENFATNSSTWSGWTGLTQLQGWSLSGTPTANTNWFEPHSTGYGGVTAMTAARCSTSERAPAT